MTSFISGPILEVQLDTVADSTVSQEVADQVTLWKITDVIHIDSASNQNINRAPAQSFSILLDPCWVSGLDSLDNVSKIKLQRTFDQHTGTESWQVI
jgi:hypothetical protein